MNLNPFIDLISLILNFFNYVLFAYLIFSWLIVFDVINRYNTVVNRVYDTLCRITEPILTKIRPYMPNLGGVDLSPLALFAIIYFINRILREYFYYHGG